MYENPSDVERARIEHALELREKHEAEKRGEEYHPDPWFNPVRDDSWHR